MTNSAVWSGDLVAWGYSDDDYYAVHVRDMQTGATVLLDRGQGGWGNPDPFWYEDRVYWMRPDHNDLVSAEPGGGDERVELVRPKDPYITGPIFAGGRMAWIEASPEGRGGVIRTVRLPRGKVERVAELTTEDADLVLSDKLLAWVEVQDEENLDGFIRVMTFNHSGDPLAEPIEIRASVSPTGTCEPGSIAVSADRLAWSASEDLETSGVYTWHLGDSLPTRVVAPPPLDVMHPHPWIDRLAVGGDRIAWVHDATDEEDQYARAYLVTWAEGDDVSQVLPSGRGANLSLPVVADGRVVWAEDPSGSLINWDSFTGGLVRADAPGLGDAYFADLRVDGNRITYVGGQGDSHDEIWLSQPVPVDASTDVQQARARGTTERGIPRILSWAIAGTAAGCLALLLLFAGRRSS